MILTHQDILNQQQRYRAAFVNSLAGFRQAVLIGSRSASGQNNLAVFNSLLHVGSQPPLYGFISRPDSVTRDTLSNIMETKSYTLNYVATSDVEKAHQTSARYPADVSEFDSVGFTTEFKDGVHAPFVNEAVVKIAMHFADKIDIKINGTIMVIGSIQYVEIDDELVSGDGFVSLAKGGVLACGGLDGYYSTQMIARLSYAKPDTWPQKLDF